MKPIAFVPIALVAALTVAGIAEDNQRIVIRKPFGEHSKRSKGAAATILYHGGPILLNQIPLYVIYYGSVPGGTQNIINTFLADLNESAPFKVNTTYTQGLGGPAISGALSSPVLFLDVNASQGKSVSSTTVTQILQHAFANGLKKDSTAVYFVVTAPDV